MIPRPIVRAVIAAAIFTVGPVAAHEYRRGTLEIDHPWARATPTMAKNGAAYVELRNTGSEPDRLISVSTPAAEKAELHRTQRDGEILRMRETPIVEIPANNSVLLAPGGLHIMLTGLKAPLKAGTEFPLTLHFEKTGPVQIEVRVERNAPSPEPSSHGH